MSSPIESVDDARRRDAEKLFSPRERRPIVKLEGVSDVNYFNEFGDTSHYIYEVLGHNMRKNGKIHIRRHLREDNGDFGIVDMDYDFKGEDLQDLERLFDTNERCCLFALIQSSQFEGDLIPFAEQVFLKLITNSSNNVLPRLSHTLHSQSTEFTAFVRERTVARLFRGFAQNVLRIERTHRGIMGRKGEKPTWSQIGDLDVSILDQEPEEIMGQYNQFKENFKDEIDAAGINDHAFRDGLELLFDEVFEEGEVPFESWLSEEPWTMLEEIDDAINQAMLEMGDSEAIRPILDAINGHAYP